MEKQKIRVGSRDSLLAVRQSEIIMEYIGAAHPELDIELITMKTTGDKILDRPLSQIGGKGLFVRELDAALLEGRIDCSVHSLKDLPMEEDPRLPLAAFTPRADPRDALVLPEGRNEPDKQKPIGCSSLRRQLMLKRLFPEYRFESVRGNLQTRLRKLDEGQYGALVLASAGLKRMGLGGRISRLFTVDEVIPAAGQGIIAVQTRAGCFPGLFDCVEDPDSRSMALAERSFVRTLEGGCSAPVAAFAEIAGDRLLLRGFYCDERTGAQSSGRLEGSRCQAEELGRRLARKLLAESGCIKPAKKE